MSSQGHKKPSHHGHKPRKKVFDIVSPGKAMASPNSRSVIPADKPPVSDDQFVPGAPQLHTRASDPSEKRELLDPKHKKELAPVAASTKTDEPAQTSDSSEVPSPSAPVLPNDAPKSAETESPTQPEPAAPKVERPEAESQPTSLLSDTEDITSQSEANAGHLALEQTVDAESGEEGADKAPEPQAAPDRGVPIQAEQHASKTIDQLLAESGAPVLNDQPTPGVLVSHHQPRTSWWPPILIFLGILLLAAIVLNFLLDTEMVRTRINIPHTDIF